MMPGVLIATIIFGAILISYALIFYFIYNDLFYECSTIFNSMVNLININFLNTLLNSKDLQYSITETPKYILYNIIILSCIFIILFITIATFTYLFKNASIVEIKKDENSTLAKLNILEEKFDKVFAKQKENVQYEPSQKQIVWLCLSGSNELYNEKTIDNHKLLLFNSSHQIIAFLKYLFAIKPKMQFKRLDRKFAIIIECKTDTPVLKESDMEQIENLFDWLNFAGCKIPVGIFTQIKLERNLKMNINSIYWNITFINLKSEIDIFFRLEGEDNEDLDTSKIQQSQGTRFNIISDNNSTNNFNSISSKKILKDPKDVNTYDANAFNKKMSLSLPLMRRLSHKPIHSNLEIRPINNGKNSLFLKTPQEKDLISEKEESEDDKINESSDSSNLIPDN